MGKRLHLPRLMRAMALKGLMTDRDYDVVKAAISNPAKGKKLQDFYAANQGKRFVDRLQLFALWVFKNKEAIFQALGIVVMFLDNGQQKLMTEEEAEVYRAEKEAEAAKDPATETPDGEAVVDFPLAGRAILDHSLRTVTVADPPRSGTEEMEDRIDQQIIDQCVELMIESEVAAEGLPSHWATEDEHDAEDCNPDNDEDDNKEENE